MKIPGATGEVRLIPGTCNRAVTTTGEVWLKRRKGWVRLKATRAGRSKKYRSVNLSGTRRAYIHRLVLLTFVGPCPPGMQACHRNGIGSDNRLENLRWDTQESNMNDRRLHGTAVIGSKHGRARLDEEKVKLIKQMAFQEEIPAPQIAEYFGVHERTVYFILEGRTWQHVA